jgi:spermidine synthase
MSAHSPSRLIYVGTFLLAASVLQLQIAITRIFAVLTWHHFTTMIISIALLGYGAAGAYLMSKKQKNDASNIWKLPKYAALYAYAVIFCFFLVIRVVFEPLNIGKDNVQVISLIIYFVALSIPFYFAGLCLVTIVSTYSANITRVYFADLAGAAIGSLLSVPAIHFLGATNTVFFVGLMAGIAALLFQIEREQKFNFRQIISVLVLGSILGLGFYFDPYLVYPPRSKELSALANPMEGAQGIEWSKWTIVARLDISKSYIGPLLTFGGSISNRFLPIAETRVVYQDGAAPTSIVRSDGNVRKLTYLDKLIHSAPYVVQRNPKVLIIGVGGGVDVLIGLYNGASHITGAEINSSLVDAVHNRYRQYSGGYFHLPNVDIHPAEGRHFLSSDQKRYDIIQLSGVDTFTALSVGAYSLSENYLYTYEAIQDYLDHLNPNGVVSFSRWHIKPPRENLRLAATMLEAIDQSGAADPQKHIVVLKSDNWAETILKRSPFTIQEMERLRQWTAQNDFELLYDPFVPIRNEFNLLLRASPAEREVFYDQYVFDVRPSTDDKPFFFNYYKWSSLFQKNQEGGLYNTPVGLITLAQSLLLILFLALAGILYPLFQSGTIERHRSVYSVLAYFAALGLGFIFVEIALIQKLIVFLGGPTYSLCITLFSLLLFSGIGSYIAKRWLAEVERRFPVLLLALVLLIVFESFALDLAIRWGLGLSLFARILLAIFMIAPLALLLGMPFPAGIHILDQRKSNWIPLAWGANSFMTVFGSLLSVLLSMQLGFRNVFLIAALIYASGYLVLRPIVQTSLKQEN